MLKKEDIATLEKTFGIKDGELAAAIADPTEKPIPVDIGTAFVVKPKADFDTLIDNLGKTKYDEGKVAGTEMKMKEIKTVFGLDVAKTIDVTALKDVVTSKVLADAKIAPDVKIQELTGDLETVKKQKTEWENKFTTLQNEYSQKEKRQKITSSVIGVLPKYGDKPGEFLIPQEDAADIILRKAADKGIVPDFSDTGDVIWKQGDKIMKDDNLVPLKGDKVLKDFYQPFVRPAGGGAGGGDNTGNPKAGTWAAFVKEMADKGIKENTMEFNTERNKRIKDKTLTI